VGRGGVGGVGVVGVLRSLFCCIISDVFL